MDSEKRSRLMATVAAIAANADGFCEAFQRVNRPTRYQRCVMHQLAYLSEYARIVLGDEPIVPVDGTFLLDSVEDFLEQAHRALSEACDTASLTERQIRDLERMFWVLHW